MASKPLTDRNWSSLSQLKTYFENQKGRGRERVLSFIGHTLETNKAVYKLGPDGLIIEKI